MTRLVDDIDGSHAVTTLSFGLDGSSYEIDLSESHLSAFRQALAPFITAARAVPNGRSAPAPRRAPVPTARAVPSRDGIAAEATARPTVDSQPVPAEPSPAEPASAEPDRSQPFRSQPFRQPSPSAESTAAQSSAKPAPLVADPFNPGA